MHVQDFNMKNFFLYMTDNIMQKELAQELESNS